MLKKILMVCAVFVIVAVLGLFVFLAVSANASGKSCCGGSAVNTDPDALAPCCATTAPPTTAATDALPPCCATTPAG